MKVLLILVNLFAATAFAQNTDQFIVTNPEYVSQTPKTYINDGHLSSKVVGISEVSCIELKEKRKSLKQIKDQDERREVRKEIKRLSQLCYVRISTDESKRVIGFELTNNTKNAINPMTSTSPSTRQFNFMFKERSIQGMYLHVTDDSGISGKMSSDMLETVLVFIPRTIIPYIDMSNSDECCTRKVVLPNEEILEFSAITNEIVSGVLKEGPMDMEVSRHSRNFADLEYTGNGIMIRADRRAGMPQNIFQQSFNVNENISKATITRKGKTCLVDKSLIWENADNGNLHTYFKYSTDQEFLDVVINGICKWNLSLSDLD